MRARNAPGFVVGGQRIIERCDRARGQPFERRGAGGRDVRKTCVARKERAERSRSRFQVAAAGGATLRDSVSQLVVTVTAPGSIDSVASERAVHNWPLARRTGLGSQVVCVGIGGTGSAVIPSPLAFTWSHFSLRRSLTAARALQLRNHAALLGISVICAVVPTGG